MADRAGVLICLLAIVCTLDPQASSSSIDDNQDDSQVDPKRSQGSWSHWWSYDGISGPDYWNINKQWRLCTAGRKQSPVNIRTDRLVYDHLLGPIQLDWLEAPAAPATTPTREQSGGQQDGEREPTAAAADVQKTKSRVQIQLVNSGRGIEVWLERVDARPVGGPRGPAENSAAPAPAQRQAGGARRHARHRQQARLGLSRGPLSYSYGLFKIELHSTQAASHSLANKQPVAPNNYATNEPGLGNANDKQGEEEEADAVPEALKSDKSSEHLIDGQTFDGELQLHFFNRQLATSGHEALRLADEQAQANLFAVISVFVVLSNGSATGREPRQEQPLDFLLDNLAAIPNQDDSIELELERRQLEALVSTRAEYVTYLGSLNRPPCAENVDWILLNRPVRVEAAKFAGLFAGSNTNQENVRPVRPLHGRQLRTTIEHLRLGERPKSQRDCAASKQAANCTARAASEDADNEQQAPAGRKPARPRQCNMKPNYVYQFSYAKMNQFR